MPRTRSRVRRGRLLIAAVIIVTAAIAAGTGVLILRSNPTPTRGGGPPAPSSTTSTTSPPPPVTPIGTYRVATTAITVPVAGPTPTDDNLPTTVWYPAGLVHAVVRRARRHRYPLVVFSQGYQQRVSSYSLLLEDWASAGFVVAGPTYPHTTPTQPAELNRADIVNHPADLRAVIAALISASKSTGSPLSEVINTNEIGLAGQSDGGDVSLAVADNTCCRYPGIKAAAILSGAEFPLFGGRYFNPATPSGPPLLVVQGDRDTINLPVCSVQLYDAAPPPKYYLDLLGATHLVPYEQAGPYEAVVATVTTDFFDAELAGERAALVQMTLGGNVAGTAQLTSAPTAPPATGACVTDLTPPGL